MKAKLIKILIYYWLPVLIWAAVIFALSARPTPVTFEIHLQDFLVKKSLHVLFFGSLATLLYRALKVSGIRKIKAGYTSIVITAIYGVTDELHQSLTPGRMPRAYDVFFDTIGAVFAIYIIWKYIPKAPKRLRNLAKIFSLN